MRVATGAALAGLMMLAALTGPLAQDGAGYDPFQDVEISDRIEDLPVPVRKKRDALIAAARSGDIEALRPIIEAQDFPPHVTFGEASDPVDHLRQVSADGEGRELLAVLVNILEAPYAVVGAGSDEPSYMWPYLAALVDISNPTPEQLVDAYRLVSVEDFKGLQEFGGWIDWRTTINADGVWEDFVAGD